MVDKFDRYSAINMVTSEFEKLASGSDHDILSVGAERHGSWEWVAARKASADSIARFVVLSVIEEPPFVGVPDPSTGPVCDVELWVAADNDRLFSRRLVSQQPAVTWFNVGEVLHAHWDDATTAEESLTSEDMTSVHLPMRRTR
jgi:hypothetical protein